MQTPVLATDVATDEEMREFSAWSPEGGVESLHETCLLHDVPLEVVDVLYGSPRSHYIMMFACFIRCPECARVVSLATSVDFNFSCIYGRTRDTDVDIGTRIGRELRQMTLLAFYRNLRDGWRLYDREATQHVQLSAEEWRAFVVEQQQQGAS